MKKLSFLVLCMYLTCVFNDVQSKLIEKVSVKHWGVIQPAVPKNGPMYQKIIKILQRDYDVNCISYILEKSDQSKWPSALRESSKYEKILSRYSLYYVGYYSYEFNFYAVFFIPQKLNADLPKKYRPENDFFVICEKPDFDLLNERNSIEFTEFMPQSSEKFNFVNFFNALGFLKSFQGYKVSKEYSESKEGENYLIKNYIPGFQNPTVGISKYGYRNFTSTFDAGSNKADAIELFNKMVNSLYSDGNCECQYSYLENENKNAVKSVKLTSSKCWESPFAIHLSLLEDKDTTGKYDIKFLLDEAVNDKVQTAWNKAGEFAINQLESSGYELILSAASTVNPNIDEHFYLSYIFSAEDKYLLKWFIFSSDSTSQTVLGNYAQKLKLKMGNPRPFDQFWLASEETSVVTEGYDIDSENTPDKNRRWALYVGKKYSPELLQRISERDERKKMEQERWVRVESDIREKLTSEGYENISSKYVTISKPEEMSLYESGKYYFVVVTPRDSLTIRLFGNGKGFKFGSMKTNDLFSHALILDFPSYFNKFYIDFGASEGDKGTALLFVAKAKL